MNKAEQIILIVEKCLYGDHNKCDCAEKINAILEEVRKERDTEILEWADEIIRNSYSTKQKAYDQKPVVERCLAKDLKNFINKKFEPNIITMNKKEESIPEEKSKCCGDIASWNFCFKSCRKCGKKFEPTVISVE